MLAVAGVTLLVVAAVLVAAAPDTLTGFGSSKLPSSPRPAGSKAPPGPRAAVEALVERAKKSRDSKEILRLAGEAEAAGYPQTAATLRELAARLQRQLATPASPSPSLTSPLHEATPQTWSKFVKLLRSHPPDAISPDRQFGVFQMSLAMLADLGLVTNVRKQPKDGREITTADWVPPHTSESFLKDLALQYRVFVKSTLDQRKTILARFASELGKSFAGRAATLSGLLAVAKQAGIRGLEAWLASKGDANKYPNTTKAFLSCTGVF